jgi:hypothetical protein
VIEHGHDRVASVADSAVYVDRCSRHRAVIPDS